MPSKCECEGEMEAIVHDEYVDYICKDCGAVVGGTAIVEDEESIKEDGKVDEL